MLNLTRRVGESIIIDERISIYVSKIRGGRVELAIECDKSVSVRRSEAAPKLTDQSTADGSNKTG